MSIFIMKRKNQTAFHLLTIPSMMFLLLFKGSTSLKCDETCQIKLPNCEEYSVADEGNFGAKRFRCSSCTTGNLPDPQGEVLQLYNITKGLPKLPITVCREIKSTTYWEPTVFPDCISVTNTTYKSNFTVKYMCTACVQGFHINENGTSNLITDDEVLDFSKLAAQNICIKNSKGHVVEAVQMVFVLLGFLLALIF